ncbi:DUF4937 domain-containing protein [Shewanella sp. 10N.286.45.A1]|uniref:DUF4937 domain-containing protein n=1 Tax=Shewanella sp. 10N.286.45.A1 TaxID=3229694 RepID=UPI0035523040
MIAKFINCQVIPSLKSTFSEGQACWQRTAESDGFIAQSGGWQKNSAIILALWESKNAADRFMKFAHDAIAEETQQQGSYSSIEVDYFTRVLEVAANNCHAKVNSGFTSCNAIKAHVNSAQFIHISRGEVLASNTAAFIEQQSKTLASAMTGPTGMLTGLLLRSNKHPQQFMLVSYWLNELSHQRALHNQQYAITEQNPMIASIVDFQINIEPNWLC